LRGPSSGGSTVCVLPQAVQSSRPMARRRPLLVRPPRVTMPNQRHSRACRAATSHLSQNHGHIHAGNLLARLYVGARAIHDDDVVVGDRSGPAGTGPLQLLLPQPPLRLGLTRHRSHLLPGHHQGARLSADALYVCLLSFTSSDRASVCRILPKRLHEGPERSAERRDASRVALTPVRR